MSRGCASAKSPKAKMSIKRQNEYGYYISEKNMSDDRSKKALEMFRQPAYGMKGDKNGRGKDS